MRTKSSPYTSNSSGNGLLVALIACGLAVLAAAWVVASKPRSVPDDLPEHVPEVESDVDISDILGEVPEDAPKVEKKKKKKKRRKKKDSKLTVEGAESSQSLLDRLYADATRRGAFDKSKVKFDERDDDPDYILASNTDGDGSNEPLPEVDPRDRGSTTKAREFRVFSVMVQGSVMGAPLKPDDKFTVGKIGYEMQQRTPAYFVRQADGKTPVYKQKGADPRLAPRPAGKAGPPRFTVMVTGNVAVSGGVQFYGRQLGRRLTATVNVQVFGMTEDGQLGAPLTSFSTSQMATEATNQAGVTPGNANTGMAVYQQALDKAAKQLKSLTTIFN